MLNLQTLDFFPYGACLMMVNTRVGRKCSPAEDSIKQARKMRSCF